MQEEGSSEYSTVVNTLHTGIGIVRGALSRSRGLAKIEETLCLYGVVGGKSSIYRCIYLNIYT